MEKEDNLKKFIIEKKLDEKIKSLFKNKKRDKEIAFKLIYFGVVDKEKMIKVYEKYQDYKLLLRQNNIIFNEYFYDKFKDIENFSDKKSILLIEKTFENFNDDIEKTIINNNAKKLLRSVISNKYKHLINETTLNLFREFYVNGIKRDEIQKLITSKLAQYEHVDDFNGALQSHLFNKIGWGHDSFSKRVREVIPDDLICYSDNNQIIFEAYNFKVSQKLGSPMWCVSRESENFDDYTYDLGRLFFKYDFSKNFEDIESLCAYVVEPTGYISSAYYKDDTNMAPSEYEHLESVMPKMTKQTIYEKLKSSREDLQFVDNNNRKDVMDKILFLDYIDVFLNFFDEIEQRQYLNKQFSKKFDGGLVAFNGAEKTFDYLTEYFKKNNEMAYRGWLHEGHNLIKRACNNGFVDFAERIFLQDDFKMFLKENNDQFIVNGLPNKILETINEKDTSHLIDKKKELAFKIMKECNLLPENTFKPLKINKHIFNFYKKYYPDYVGGLSKKSEKGELLIYSLITREKVVSSGIIDQNSMSKEFKDKIEILKDLNFSLEERCELHSVAEREFNKAIKHIDRNNDNIENILKDYKELFSFLDDKNYEKAIKKETVSLLIMNSRYSDLNILIEKGCVLGSYFSEIDINFFKKEEQSTLHIETKKALNSIIKKIEYGKNKKSNQIKRSARKII